MIETMAPESASARGIDPVQLQMQAMNSLQMQAMNSLSRCKHLVLASEPMYTFALQELDVARKALAALAAVDQASAH